MSWFWNIFEATLFVTAFALTFVFGYRFGYNEGLKDGTSKTMARVHLKISIARTQMLNLCYVNNPGETRYVDRENAIRILERLNGDIDV